MRFVYGFALSIALAACSDGMSTSGDASLDVRMVDDQGGDRTMVREDVLSADAAMDAAMTDVGVDAGRCVDCSQPGMACVDGMCRSDCRLLGAVACAAGTACDYSDGRCRSPSSPCFIARAFEACPSDLAPDTACGPGTVCRSDGVCVLSGTAVGLACDALGRCWAESIPCERPAPACRPAPLDRLNQSDFVGSIVNGNNQEGAFDLEFDDQCAAYAVTMISGPDYLRQLTADGTFTQWQSVTNLNMGEVAMLPEQQGGTVGVLGEIAATYICCASCGCRESGMDGRLGVIRLDRTSMSRPLPNVIAARATEGTAPFGNAGLDTGPYGLVWGSDDSLYVGNVTTNGEFVRADLRAATTTTVAMFASRVVAAANYDPRRLLIGLQSGEIHVFDLVTRATRRWTTLPRAVTSIARDRHTGRVYVETTDRTGAVVLELSAEGAMQREFQRPRALGRIAIAPDGFLYHLNVYPNTHWRGGQAIQRWPLPMTR